VSEENKDLVRRWFEEVWNQGRSDAIDELLASGGIVHGLSEDTDNPIRGPEDFKPFHETFRGAFPDVAVAVEEIIAEGDMVAARCLVRANHAGDHLGVPASNAAVHFTGIAIVRIEDGKIVEAWNNFDFLQMNKQIGLN